jgi:hypothetical protein
MTYADDEIDDLTEERANPNDYSVVVDDRGRYVLCPYGHEWPQRRHESEPLWYEIRGLFTQGAVIPVSARMIPQPPMPVGMNFVVVGFSASLATAFYGWPDRTWT